MTKDEALAFDLALETLENNRRTHYYCEDTWYSCPKHEDGCANEAEGDECNCGADKANQEIDNAITAIKQARALDKKAENARELGLDYEPVAPVQEDWGPGPHEYHSLTASVQEFVAWRYRGILHEFDPSDWAEGPVTPLYTTPPAQPAPVQERNFCERCGKRLGSGIHTCTPPAAPVQEPDEWLTGCPECGMDSGCDCDSGTWNPPAAQRPWVGLTNEEIAQIYLVNTDKPLKADWLFARAIERKLKEKNT